MSRWVWPLSILLVAAGAAVGYLSVPHYNPPHNAGEPRLRERAAAYYQASRRFDMQGMARLYTPAYQLSKDGKLAKIVEANNLQRSRSSEAKLREFEAAARGIDPAHIETQVDGDWAVTSGTANLPAADGKPAQRVPLETIVWVRSAGDWWVCQMQYDEIRSYGNPPDFARNLLSRDTYKPAEIAANPPADTPQPEDSGGS
jgi:hypothetical protein